MNTWPLKDNGFPERTSDQFIRHENEENCENNKKIVSKKKRSKSIDLNSHASSNFLELDAFISSKRRKSCSIEQNLLKRENFSINEHINELSIHNFDIRHKRKSALSPILHKTMLKPKNEMFLRSEGDDIIGSEEQYFEPETDPFKNMNASKILYVIKNKFLLKDYNLNFEKKALEYLKLELKRFPSRNKNPMGSEFSPISDMQIISLDNDKVILCLEVLLIYFKRKSNNKKAFLFVFNEKDIIKLIEQLRTDDSKEATCITKIIQYLIYKFENYLATIKRFIFNELILYFEGSRHHKGVLELINLIYFVQSKDKFENEQESMYFFDNCILPLLKKNILEVFTDESIIKIFDQFFEINFGFIKITLEFVQKRFNEATAKSKSIMFSVVNKIFKGEFTVEENNEILQCICFIINIMLLSHHHILIDQVYEYFNRQENRQQIKKNIFFIMPQIFPALYNTSKNYWSEQDKSKIFSILHIIMKIDKSLFDDCLTKYNKDSVKKQLNKNENDELTNEMFNSCIDIDYDIEKLKKIRRMSLLPIESETTKFVYEIDDID